MYKERYTGEIMTYDQMVEYCKENYDYGDETNYITYMSEWWKEYDFVKVYIQGGDSMWIVYNKADSYLTGFEVPTESEAIEYCEENPEYRYVYVKEMMV